MNVHMLRYRKLIIFILCFSMILPCMTWDNMTVYAATKGVCTASKLMIRKGPGADYAPVQVNGEDAYLINNQIVDIISSEDGWYKIKAVFNNVEVEGYSSALYIKQAEDAGIDQGVQKGICTANLLMIRKGPGTGYDKLSVSGTEAYLTNGQSVEILSEENDWYKIKAVFLGTTIEGWSSSTYIRVVETSASTPTPKPTSAPKPTSVPVSSEYTLKQAATVTASSSLNLRKTAGTDGEKLAALSNGQALTIIGEEKSETENWYKVTAKVSGKTLTGYVLSDFVKIKVGSGFYANVLKDNVKPVATAGGTSNVKLEDGSTWTVNKGRTWISEEVMADGQKWFRIGQSINGTAVRGYVKAEVIELLGQKTAQTPTPVPADGASDTDGSTSLNNVKAHVTVSTLNIRKKATVDSDILGSLTKDDEITVLELAHNGTECWYYISVTINKKEVKGYVYSPYVKLTLTNPIEAVIKSSINIRSKAAANAAYLKNSSEGLIKLAGGSIVSIIQESDVDLIKWFKINFTYDSKKYSGYVTADQVDFHIPTPSPSPTAAPTPTPSKAPEPSKALEIVMPSDRAVLQNVASQLTIRSASGYSSGALYDESSLVILLKNGHEVKVLSGEEADEYIWYKVSFDYKGVEYIGYIREYYLEFTEPDNSNGAGTGVGTGTGEPAASNSDFEAVLLSEGFPESYKAYLRKLHELHPNWQFRAYHTGLEWSAVIENESGAGINLIPNSKGIEWKSTDEKAYNWKTDSFIVYDGSTWVTASKEAVAYYMDPRNFLDEKNIFQFEVLTYQPSYQNLAGVENILKNTAFFNTSYKYVDQNSNTGTITYGETFIKAAEYSGVSPYHLVSRAKQEVVTGTTALSDSVTGTVTGFEGLFNYYNIGAYHSTVAGGSIANGLKYAKNGSTNAELNSDGLIPWNNQYKSIVGGAYIIGSSYISKGQDTIYLQKFNVTPVSTYSHQYMANVEAPASEGKKVFTAYGDNVSGLPIVFSIPVYLNMPASIVSAPSLKYNPNNWLSSLKITDMAGNNLILTPAFGISDNQEYYLTVSKNIELVNVTASAVSKKATVSGEGIYQLTKSSNLIIVYVVAENGDIREYKITIVKG